MTPRATSILSATKRSTRLLLNEFLKEHRKNEEQEVTIARLEKELGTVVARLKEYDAKIQKVTAQIEVSKAVGQTALNNP